MTPEQRVLEHTYLDGQTDHSILIRPKTAGGVFGPSETIETSEEEVSVTVGEAYDGGYHFRSVVSDCEPTYYDVTIHDPITTAILGTFAASESSTLGAASVSTTITDTMTSQGGSITFSGDLSMENYYSTIHASARHESNFVVHSKTGYDIEWSGAGSANLWWEDPPPPLRQELIFDTYGNGSFIDSGNLLPGVYQFRGNYEGSFQFVLGPPKPEPDVRVSSASWSDYSYRVSFYASAKELPGSTSVQFALKRSPTPDGEGGTTISTITETMENGDYKRLTFPDSAFADPQNPYLVVVSSYSDTDPDNDQTSVVPLDIALRTPSINSSGEVEVPIIAEGFAGPIDVSFGFYWSSDWQFGADDVSAEVVTRPILPRYIASPETFPLPAGGDPSRPYLIVVADDSKSIVERAEYNNDTSVRLGLDAAIEPKDIVMTPDSSADNYWEQPFAIDISVRAPQLTVEDVEVWITRERNGVAKKLENLTIPQIPGGGSETISLSWNLDPQDTIKVRLDPSNTIVEVHEDNNEAEPTKTSGTVLNSAGAAIKHTLVTLVQQEGSSYVEKAHTFTDNQGRYAFFNSLAGVADGAQSRIAARMLSSPDHDRQDWVFALIDEDTPGDGWRGLGVPTASQFFSMPTSGPINITVDADHGGFVYPTLQTLYDYHKNSGTQPDRKLIVEVNDSATFPDGMYYDPVSKTHIHLPKNMNAIKAAGIIGHEYTHFVQDGWAIAKNYYSHASTHPVEEASATWGAVVALNIGPGLFAEAHNPAFTDLRFIDVDDNSRTDRGANDPHPQVVSTYGGTYISEEFAMVGVMYDLNTDYVWETLQNGKTGSSTGTWVYPDRPRDFYTYYITKDSRPSTTIKTVFQKHGYSPTTLGWPGKNGLDPDFFTGVYTDYVIDDDGNGLSDTLAIDVGLDIAAPGRYSLSGELRGLEQSATTTEDLEAGRHTVTLFFDGANVFGATEDGPFTFSGFLSNDANELIDFRLDSYSTSHMRRDEFERPPIQFANEYTESGRDTDGNGLIDDLVIQAELQVAEEGTYQVFGQLYSGDELVPGEASTGPLLLSPGQQTVEFAFAGKAIGAGMLDGPYTIELSIPGSSRIVTSAYRYTDFESETPVSTSIVSDIGSDNDQDGFYDSLVVGVDVVADNEAEYWVSGNLYTSDGTYVAQANANLTAVSGNNSVLLTFSGTAIHDVALDGPYEIEIEVLDDDGFRVGQASGISSIYLHTQFQRDKGDLFELLFSDISSNPNGDGLFDDIIVAMDVASDVRQGLTRFEASLYDSTGLIVGFDEVTVDVGLDPTRVPLTFSGEPLYQNGLPGICTLELVAYDANGSRIVVLDDIHTVSKFGPSQPAITSLDIPSDVEENEVLVLTGELSNPDMLAMHTVVVDWGDGKSETHELDLGHWSFTIPHQYADSGSGVSPSHEYAVSVTVTDDEESVTSSATAVTVHNVVPTMSSLSTDASVVDEGDAILLSAAFSDPGEGDAHDVVIEWGDGTSDTFALVNGEREFARSHVYLDDRGGEESGQNYVINVTVIDDDGGSSADAGIALPADFGYYAFENEYEDIDLIVGGAAVITVVDNYDDGYGELDLAGDSFNFYGEQYVTEIYPNSNGYIAFEPGYVEYSNQDLSSSPEPAVIAPLFDDWRTDADTADAVLARFDDLDADGIYDRLVIEWSDIPTYSGAPSIVTFQAILELNTGDRPGEIIFNYRDLDTEDEAYSDGADATVGIKNSNELVSDPLLISYNEINPYIGSERAVFITTTVQATSTRVNVRNVDPTVTIEDAPTVVRVGTPLDISAAVTDDGILDTFTYSWTVTKDGSEYYTSNNSNLAFTPNAAGSYVLHIAVTDDDGGIGTDSVVINVPPVHVVDVTINDGTSSQRSMVTGLVVTFNDVVSIDSGAFAVAKQGGGSVGLVVDQDDSSGVSVFSLTFTGEDITGGSLSDGEYLLTIAADSVHSRTGESLDGDGDGLVGGDHVFGDEITDAFFRLFGDSDGDRDTDFSDYLRLRGAYGTDLGDSGYLWHFDFDGDGDVDYDDLLQFRLRLGKRL